jgi:hypothetical protein
MASFKAYMSHIEADVKARPENAEMYVLGARQVMEAVGMQFSCLTRKNVRKHFYEPLQDQIKSEKGCKFSIKTARNKLKFLEYFCTYLLGEHCTG